MCCPNRRMIHLEVALLFVALLASATAEAADHDEGALQADNAAAMNPRHQCAVDIADAELRCGNDEQLRRLAQEIIMMRQAPGKLAPPSRPASDQAAPGPQPDGLSLSHSMLHN